MKKITYAGLLFGALLMAGLFTACNKNDNNDTGGTAELHIRLTDGPADYDAVNIDVQGIEIHSDESGWDSLVVIHPGVYNLLDFRNGMDTLLVNATLPAGHISQMRLLLGNQNSIVVNGQSFPLATPSAMQSGLKFNIQQDLAPNGVYRMWIDFDAARSIVQQGNGNYSLKPVIRTYLEETNGRIRGVVLPSVAQPIVYAIRGADTAIALPDMSGNFLFSGMPEGYYHIWARAQNSHYQDVHVDSIQVQFGQETDVDTLLLPAL